jgi:hypothetical protein
MSMQKHRIGTTALTLVGLSLLIAQCAPRGYHYETGSLTPTPNDVCQRKELVSQGAISWINSSVGHTMGVSSQVYSINDLASADRIQLASIGLQFNSNAGSILCHATLTFTSGASESGVLSMYDPGAYAPVQIEWVTDTAIAGRRAEVDRLRTSGNLLVKPDLTTPSIQKCVGRSTALGFGEQFPGQLWAACADKNNPLSR